MFAMKFFKAYVGKRKLLLLWSGRLRWASDETSLLKASLPDGPARLLRPQQEQTTEES